MTLIRLTNEMRTMSDTRTSQTFPLNYANKGETVTLVEIHAGNRLRQRLCALGLNIGSTVRIVQICRSGPVILAVHNDSRVALGHGMAQKIMVSHVEGNA